MISTGEIKLIRFEISKENKFSKGIHKISSIFFSRNIGVENQKFRFKSNKHSELKSQKVMSKQGETKRNKESISKFRDYNGTNIIQRSFS